MTAKHTPGPWEVSGGTLRIYSAKTKDIVGWVATESPENGLAPSPPVAIANAHLVAASPDLLAALTALMADIDAQLIGSKSALREQARAAIAKATGGRQ
jgi:hypothetical protein